jgi:branched-chain amino acid transport system permease protein
MFFQQLVNGLLLGSTYSLIALGFTLMLGVLGLLNFAHGEVFMISAYVGFTFATAFKLPFAVAAAAGTLAGGILAVAIYYVSFAFVKREYFAAPILSTIGVAMVLQMAATRIWGSDIRPFPEPFGQDAYQVGPVLVSSVQIGIMLVAFLIMVGFYILLKRSKLGKAMRAISESPTRAALLGVKVERVILVTFFISGMLAGIAGILIGLAFHALTPFMGLNVLLKGITVMILGGLGNVVGAMVGGLIIGLVETFSVAYWAASYRDALVFLILILVLILKPSGLFGTRQHEERM